MVRHSQQGTRNSKPSNLGHRFRADSLTTPYLFKDVYIKKRKKQAICLTEKYLRRVKAVRPS